MKHSEGNEEPLAEIPEWLLEKLAPAGSSGRKSTSGKAVEDDGVPIPEGERNAHMTSLAGSMRHRGMGEEAISAALLKENIAKCVPPLDEAEVFQIAHSVSRYSPGIQATTEAMTDLGNARRLVAQHGMDLRPVVTAGLVERVLQDARRVLGEIHSHDNGEASRGFHE